MLSLSEIKDYLANGADHESEDHLETFIKKYLKDYL